MAKPGCKTQNVVSCGQGFWSCRFEVGPLFKHVESVLRVERTKAICAVYGDEWDNEGQ